MSNDPFTVFGVSKADRDDAENRLRRRYIDGQIDAAEFDARMGRVITAERPEELAGAVEGPLAAHRWGEVQPLPYSFAPEPRPRTDNPAWAVLAHLSPFVTWLIGPAIIWALSPVGSRTRSEAAKAFNWQLISFVIGIVVSVVGGLLPGDGNPLSGIWTLIWVALTIVGAVMAGKGADWRNPIRSMVNWEVLSERRR